MARPDRNPNRRVQTRSKATISEGLTKVCLVTSPSSNDGASLAHDVELAKAAVLYADSVEMIGLGVDLIERLRQLMRQPHGTLRWFLDLDDEALAHVSGGRDVVQVQGPGWRDRVSKALDYERYRFSDPARWATVVGWLDRIREVEAGAQPLVDSILETSGAAELAVGVDAGVIRVAQLGVTMSHLYRPSAMRDGDSTAAVAAWVEHISTRLGDRRFRMIFDADSADLLSDLVSMGKVRSDPQASRLAHQGSLGAGLVASLPAFPEARMDELLDLRSELAIPVANYQASVIKYARQLPEELHPGPDLSFEIGQIYEELVRPAVLGIEQSIQDSGFVREAVRRVGGRDLGIFATGASVSTYLGATTSVGALTMGALGSAASAVPALAEAARETFKARRQQRQTAEHQEFYLLYAANRRIEQARAT